MRMLTAYGIGVVIVLAVLNGIAWQAGMPRLHSLNVFSAGFVLGVLGTYISAWLNGYRRVAWFQTESLPTRRAEKALDRTFYIF
jgi:hypothetical protein